MMNKAEFKYLIEKKKKGSRNLVNEPAKINSRSSVSMQEEVYKAFYKSRKLCFLRKKQDIPEIALLFLNIFRKNDANTYLQSDLIQNCRMRSRVGGIWLTRQHEVLVSSRSSGFKTLFPRG